MSGIIYNDPNTNPKNKMMRANPKQQPKNGGVQETVPVSREQFLSIARNYVSSIDAFYKEFENRVNRESIIKHFANNNAESYEISFMEKDHVITPPHKGDPDYEIECDIIEIAFADVVTSKCGKGFASSFVGMNHYRSHQSSFKFSINRGHAVP